MRIFRPREEDPFAPYGPGPVDEVPPGYRLRRVGPGEWVAEPTRWILWGFLIAAVMFSIGGVVGAFAARAYYHRTATVLLLKVNGTPLRIDELRNRLVERHGVEEVIRFATFELSRQFAERRGCWPSEEEVKRRMERERARPDFAERLAIFDLTESEYQQELWLDMAQTNLLTKGVTVTDAEVREFYRRNADPDNPAARYYTPDRVQVTAVGVSNEEIARQALQEVRNGVPWKTVVARYSEHISRRTGGLIPPFARGESVFATNPRTEAAIFSLRPGDRLGPVPAGRMWWVIRCENQWRRTVIPWEDAKEDARIGAMVAKGVRLNRAKLEKEREEFVHNSSIFVADPAYGEAQEVVLSRPVRW